MREKIKIKIQKAQAKSEFNVNLISRPRGAGKAQKSGFVKRFQRNENLDVLDSDGNLILRQVHVDHTLSPKEQYLKSARNPYRKES